MFSGSLIKELTAEENFICTNSCKKKKKIVCMNINWDDEQNIHSR